MTTNNAQKKSTNYKVLIQVGMKMHNPQVIQAYGEKLDSEDSQIKPIYGKYLRLYPEDSVWEILIKFFLFYIVDGRLWVQESTPMWWALKKERFKPQLAIQYRPAGDRKRFAFESYAGNPELHIPHYNGEPNPHLPSYTIGKYSAKYMLNDGTYILVNAHTLEEAIEVVAKHASYTKPSKRPEGEILENITTTSRKRKPRMDGIKIEPFKAKYFTGGKDGLKSGVKIQF
jgi:hypothetical protein